MEAIYDCGGKLNAIFTLEDQRAVRKSGRIYVDSFASHHDIAVHKLANINDEEARKAIAAADLDWLFVIGWSQIVRPPVLQIPRCGVLGMHPTLLPEGRGRAAIPWAILKGLAKTGVTMFKLDSGVDTGPIIAQMEFPIQDGADAGQLYADVEAAHAKLMRETFPKLAAGEIEMREQDHSKASVWPGRKPEDGAIDLSGSVLDAERLVRAVTRPYPGAFIQRLNGRQVIWRAEISQAHVPEGEGDIIFPDGRLKILESEWVPMRP